jgi:hypothetical protein
MSAKGYHYLVLSGHLMTEVIDGVIQWRFAEESESATDPNHPPVHPITHGDLLKVFDRENTLVWSGVVAYNYNMMAEPDPDKPDETIQKIKGKVVAGIQSSARPVQWLEWFEHRYRARLEIRINNQNTPQEADLVGPEDPEAPVDPEVERERLIQGVLHAHDRNSVGKPVRNTSPEHKKAWWED